MAGDRQRRDVQRSRRGPAALVAVVVGTGVVVALSAAVVAGAASTPTTRPAGIPRTMAGYSYLTGSVSLSPPGPAVALWHQGFGVELMDLPQALVLSAHDESYRRVDLAERRGGADTQGDPGPMLLSPGGTHVAVGDHSARTADLALLDLSTGDVERFPVPGARSLLPVAWSPDGRHVAYLAGEAPSNPYAAAPPTGRPGVLDVTTGEARSWPGDDTAGALAFSPDGRELAVQWSGAGLDVRSVDGTPGRGTVLRGPGRLAGAAAWSPDGRLVAVTTADGLAFLDATGSGAAVPDPLGPGRGLDDEVLGWTGPREVVVAAADEPGDGGTGDLRVLRVDLDDRRQEPLTTLPADGNYGIGRFQLATALLPDLEVRAAGEPDRGLWPVWLWAVTALLLAAVVRTVRRAGRRLAGRAPAVGARPVSP